MKKHMLVLIAIAAIMLAVGCVSSGSENAASKNTASSGRDDARVRGEAEVVVRAEVEDLLRRGAGGELDLDLGPLGVVDEALLLEEAGGTDRVELGTVDVAEGGDGGGATAASTVRPSPPRGARRGRRWSRRCRTPPARRRRRGSSRRTSARGSA